MVLHRVHHQILRTHHLFEPLNDEQLDELMGSSQLLSVDKGEPLFRQGEPAEAFYFVIAGAVKIYRLTPDGQEKVFEVIGPRQTFAEAMMLMDTPIMSPRPKRSGKRSSIGSRPAPTCACCRATAG